MTTTINSTTASVCNDTTTNLISLSSVSPTTENVVVDDRSEASKIEKNGNNKKLSKYDDDYQKKTSWIIFFVILIFFSIVSFSCLAMIYNIREGSIVSGLEKIANEGALLKQQSIYYYTRNATGQITGPELVSWSKLPAKVVEVENDLLQLRSDAKTSWKISLGYGLFHFFCL
eukprot:Awhi_evm1s13793